MRVAAPAPAPTTATGTRHGNVDGQAIAITVFSAVKWWGRVVLPVVFLAPKVAPKTLTTLQRLSFIHYARWSLVTEIPHNGAPQPEVKLRYPHLYFESNFNGGWRAIKIFRQNNGQTISIGLTGDTFQNFQNPDSLILSKKDFPFGVIILPL